MIFFNHYYEPFFTIRNEFSAYKQDYVKWSKKKITESVYSASIAAFIPSNSIFQMITILPLLLSELPSSIKKSSIATDTFRSNWHSCKQKKQQKKQTNFFVPHLESLSVTASNYTISWIQRFLLGYGSGQFPFFLIHTRLHFTWCIKHTQRVM